MFFLIEFLAEPNSNVGFSFGVESADSVLISSVAFPVFTSQLFALHFRMQNYSVYQSRDLVQWDLHTTGENTDTVPGRVKIESDRKWKYIKVPFLFQDKILSTGICVGIPGIDHVIPDYFVLSPNYPNPFNLQTTITFGLAQSELSSLKVYDGLGSEIRWRVNEYLSAGTHLRNYSAAELNSGFYFYTLCSNSSSKTKKC